MSSVGDWIGKGAVAPSRLPIRLLPRLLERVDPPIVNGTGPGRPTPLAPRAVDGPEARLSAVRDDMTHIFAELPAAPPPATRGRSGAPTWWPWALAVLLLVGLALIGRGWRPAHAPTTASVAPVASAPPADAPPPAPPPPVEAPPPPVERPKPAPAKRDAALAERAAAPIERRRTPVHAAPTGPAPSSSPAPVAETRASSAPSADCPAGYAAWCLRDKTNAADRDLRRAYYAAIDAGVKGGELRALRREWVRYRRLANKKPEELIRGYDGLTRQLHELRAAGAGDRPNG